MNSGGLNNSYLCEVINENSNFEIISHNMDKHLSLEGNEVSWAFCSLELQSELISSHLYI